MMRVALLCALLLAPGLASSTEASGRIARVREDPVTGRVFLELTPAPTRTCIGGGIFSPAETYVFDADTAGGRALQAQVLSGYTVYQAIETTQYVYVLGTGTCLTLGSGISQTRFEFVSRVSACAASSCPAP